MRVVFVDNVCDPLKPRKSGHSDIVWAMAEHVAELGVESLIVAPYDRVQAEASTSRVEVLPFSSIRNPNKNPITRILQVIQAVKVIKQNARADIVHVTDAFSAGIASVLVRNIPVVFTTSGSIYQRQRSSYRLDAISAMFYYAVSILAAHFVALVVATSNEMAHWWNLTGVPTEKIRTIPLGVTWLADSCSPRDRLNRTPIRVLFVGRMHGENNPEHLRDLASMLSSEISYRLGIVGDGPLLPMVESMLADFSEVRFYGALEPEQLWRLYREFDVLVVTREAGATPRVALEAMANGLAVIGFRGAGLEEYVGNGQGGFLVPKGSISEIAKLIVTLAEDPDMRFSQGRKAWQLMHTNYGWAQIADRLVSEVYGDLNGR